MRGNGGFTIGAAACAIMLLFATAAPGPAAAQSVEPAGHFAARLSATPIDLGNAPDVTGSGSASASLEALALTVEGTFSGLSAPATAARLHVGEVTGVRGEAVAELDVDRASAGEVTGTLQLSPELAAALAEGRMYLQIDSEAAPDGNLWGWLLP